jgi:uncharacterized protein YfiM (DUF2279 family)
VREPWNVPAWVRLLGWALLLNLVWVLWGEVGADDSIIISELNLKSSPREADHRGADSFWARDKRIHLLVSAGMVGASYHLLYDRWDYQAEDSRRIAVSVTALAGLLKEISDTRKVSSTCSYKDLIADGAGILVGILIFTR